MAVVPGGKARIIPAMCQKLLHWFTSPLAALILIPCLGGCATAEFDLVSPPEFKQHIGKEKETVITAGPLEYRLIAMQNRLVVEVFNRSGEDLHFIGNQSTLVDPSGQSHTLRPTTLQPGAQMKWVFPPLSEPAPGGSSRGYYGPAWEDSPGRSDFSPGLPPSRAVAATDTSFDWPDDSDVRLVLIFQRGNDAPFTQEWEFRKQRI